MTLKKILLVSPILLFMGALTPSLAYSFPGEEFHQKGQDIYDEWDIARTRHRGADGFLARASQDFDPVITLQSLGEEADLAWQLGEEFALNYPNRNQRAEEIFYFVRDRVVYTSDQQQFGIAEFAVNADELALAITENRVAEGDCEDMAALLAVMYKAAGYRSAMVLMSGHIATMVYLPDYGTTPKKMSVGGEGGWVWAEATMDSNPLGWIPESLVRKGAIAKEVTLERRDAPETSALLAKVEPDPLAKGIGPISIEWLVILFGLSWLLFVVLGLIYVARCFRLTDTKLHWTGH